MAYSFLCRQVLTERREFFIPKKWIEQEYVTFLSGCKQLAPRDVIINNMSLPDVELQDLIAGAEKVVERTRTKCMRSME